MKKILLTTLCALAVTGAAIAQGTVTWANIGGNFIAQTNSTTYSTFVGTSPGQATGFGGVAATPGSGTSLFYYALLYTSFSGSQAVAPTTLLALDTWSNSGLVATNGLAANGRINAVGSSTGATVPWAAGVTNSIMLVGWSSNLGNNYLSVSNVLANWSALGSSIVGPAFFGVSSTGYTSPNVGNPGPTIFNASPNANGLPINSIVSPAQLFLLQPVPEPGTLALCALGGASLLLFRRKKV